MAINVIDYKLKVPNANLATGTWAPNQSQHIVSLQIPQKVLALNRDKVFAMGLPFKLYTKVDPSIDSTHMIQCSCFRDTTQQSDAPCLSCYGLRYHPGYLLFGHRTIWYGSIQSDLELSNVELDKTITPFRLKLSNAALSGTIITPYYNINDINTGRWSYKLDAYVRDSANTSIRGEFTIDHGFTWHDLNILGTSLYNPSKLDTIKFKITLYRNSVTNKSPLYEMLRARFPRVVSPRPTGILPVDSGDILLLKTYDQERFKREVSGTQTENEGQRYWTLPLSYFDDQIERESIQSILGVDHFVEETSGPETGVRYVSTKHAYSRTFTITTHQSFNLRRVIGTINNNKLGEMISKVW
jgi:hypothetical protein